MRTFIHLIIFSATVVLVLVPSKNYSQTVHPDLIDGIIYAKVFDTSSVELSPYNFSDPALNVLHTVYGITSITKPFYGINTTLNKTYRITFSQIMQIDSLIAGLQLLSYIEYAEKAPLYRTSYTPNDLNGNQWALTKINALQAWDIATGSINITIAIVDNAVSTTHDDLRNNIWINPNEVPNNLLDDDLNGFTDDINGWDAADGDNNPNPPAGITTSSPFVHGTHCSGIASASTDNATGIASIGFKAKIIAVKCSKNNSADQGQSLTNAYDGFFYAMKVNADVISMSWGGLSGAFTTGANLISAAHTLGIILVAAAGNQNTTTPFYPASYNNVISVGATNQTDQKASFSNYGSTIDVMAPGTSIYSTLAGANNAYGSLSGTSMACPMVAGLAALILSANPNLSPAAVETNIKDGADNIDALNISYSGLLGTGRINAYNSLLLTLNIEDDTDASSMHLFPNPSRGTFTLVIGDDTSIFTITVLSITGQKIIEAQEILVDGKKDFDISTLAPGVYFIKAENNSSVSSKKLVLQ